MSQKTNYSTLSSLRTRGILFWFLLVSVVAYGEPPTCTDIRGNETQYNPRTYICCDGTIINHQNQRFKCYTFTDGSQRWYDVFKERVCKDFFYSAEDVEIQCSSSGPYNSTTSIDCEGEIHSLEEGDACCGTSIMNSSLEVCCRNRGISVPLTPEECCANTSLNARDLPCCAGSLFNRGEKMCCQENLYNKTSYLRCSRDTEFPIYDYRTHFEGEISGEFKVIEIVDGKTSSCGMVAFNPNNSFCDQTDWKVKVTDSKSGSRCGSVHYNKENATCCQDIITEGVPEIRGIIECNGSVPVFMSDHLICNKTVYRKSESVDEECCGGDVYRTDTQICCRGIVYPKSSPSTDCCGNVTYDNSMQLCYNGLKPLNVIVNGTTDESKACDGRLLRENEICKRDDFVEMIVPSPKGGDAVCGSCGYKQDEYFCDRNHHLVPHEPHEGLCPLLNEDRLFDTRSFICCGSRILPKLSQCGKERDCCNGEVFIPEYETCSLWVWKIPTCFASRCGMTVYDNRTHVCDLYNRLVVEKEEFIKKPSVCRDKSDIAVRFNESDHFCCNGNLWSRAGYIDPDCCNGVPFDKASPNHICCAGSLIRTGGVPMTCEGSVAYSEGQQVCGGVVYEKSDGECCGSGVYDPQTELCCEDTVKISKSSETERCCGLAKFDEVDGSLVCCSNSTLHKNVPGFQCCGSSIMNPAESICLNNEFVLSRRFEDKTCNASILEHPNGTCCAGILHVGKYGSCDGLQLVGRAFDQLWCGQGLLKHGEACCDGIPYDEESYTCFNDSKIMPTCSGIPFEKSSHSCCNQIIINNEENMCCSGHIRRRSNGNDRCCGERAYSSGTQICCREKVKNLEDDTADLNKCCPRNQRFELTSGTCQQESVCSVCPEFDWSPSEVAALATNSSQQVIIKVTGHTSGSREISVRVLELPKECRNCSQDAKDQGVRALVLPDGCICQFVLNKKYLLLANSVSVEEGKWMLGEGASILPRKWLRTVIRYIDGGTSHSK